ncbi:MAG: hypothetical protein AYK18_14955 [Theionarchaea archaeon DG-70]|nr:MAG: hypothetical protein AYK18_14955 [Theionarchaea archaeon DG-70]
MKKRDNKKVSDTDTCSSESVREKIVKLDLLQQGVLDTLLLKGKEGLSTEEIGNRPSVKDTLEELRKNGLIYYVDEQRNNQWVQRYFVKKETLEALDKTFLAFVIDHPGTTTQEILDQCPYCYQTVSNRLSELTEKGLIRLETVKQEGKITEKWHSTVVVA